MKHRVLLAKIRDELCLNPLVTVVDMATYIGVTDNAIYACFYREGTGQKLERKAALENHWQRKYS